MASGGDYTHSNILVSSDYSLKRHLQTKRVISELLALHEFDKPSSREYKLLKKCGRSSSVDLDDDFLAVMKSLSVDVFASFLKVLDSFGDDSSITILRVFAPELRLLRLSPGSRPQRIVAEIISKHTISKEELDRPWCTPRMVSERPIYHSLGCSSVVKMTNTGGKYYSPVTGVSVDFPSSSIPLGVQEFELCVDVGVDEGGWDIDDSDAQQCTPTVALSCVPDFHFTDGVTISLPHCLAPGFDKDGLCAFRCSEGRKIIEELKPLSSAYDLSLRVTHFCKYRGYYRSYRDRAKQLRRKMAKAQRKPQSFDCDATHDPDEIIPNFKKSLSLPGHSASAGTRSSDLQYMITMYKPRDENLTSWKALFIITFALPNLISKIEAVAHHLLEAVSGSLDNCCRVFVPDGDLVCLSPEEWRRGGWAVTADASTQISVGAIRFGCEVLRMTSSPGSPNPACVEYSIVAEEQCFSSLDCRIDVKGPSPGKRIVYFVLKYPAIRPGPTCTEQQQQSIVLDSSLFQDTPPTSATCSSCDGESPLLGWRRSSDCTRLLALLSFRLPRWRELAKPLQLSEPDTVVRAIAANYAGHEHCYEAAYQLLFQWLKEKSKSATIRSLRSALKEIGVTFEFKEVIPFESVSVLDQHQLTIDKEFLLELSKRTCFVWKFLGRTLGLKEFEIEALASNYSDVEERCYQAFLQWKTSFPSLATCGYIARVVHMLHSILPQCSSIDDAYMCTVKWYEAQLADLDSDKPAAGL